MKHKSSEFKKTIIYVQDSFYIDIDEYQSSKVTQKLRELLRNRKYSLRDSQTTSRVLSHWDNFNLLPDGIKENGWKKFTLVELVWIEAIVAMRKFGLSLEKIKEVKDHVLDWDEGSETYPVFEFYISKSFTTDDPYIVITQSGSDLGCSRDIEYSKLVNGSQHMLLLSFKSILKVFKLETQSPKRLFSLTPAELEVLYGIRIEDIDSLKIKVRDGRIKEMESSKIQSQNLESDSRIQNDFRAQEEYGSVITQYEKGQVKSRQIKRKKRF